jgi:hypothetical protein
MIIAPIIKMQEIVVRIANDSTLQVWTNQKREA